MRSAECRANAPCKSASKRFARPRARSGGTGAGRATAQTVRNSGHIRTITHGNEKEVRCEIGALLLRKIFPPANGF